MQGQSFRRGRCLHRPRPDIKNYFIAVGEDSALALTTEQDTAQGAKKQSRSHLAALLFLCDFA